jgi:CRISPR-associated protein Csc3
MAVIFKELFRLKVHLNFWNFLQLPRTLYHQNWIGDRMQSLAEILNRILVAYRLHLETQ